MLLYSDSCSQVEQITGKIACIMAIYEYQIIHISDISSETLYKIYRF